MATEAETKQEITGLLLALRRGDASAMDRLVPLVYDDLRRRARQQLRRLPHATLSTTGLVHEAYLKLASALLCAKRPGCDGRALYTLRRVNLARTTRRPRRSFVDPMVQAAARTSDLRVRILLMAGSEDLC